MSQVRSGQSACVDGSLRHCREMHAEMYGEELWRSQFMHISMVYIEKHGNVLTESVLNERRYFAQY